MSYVLDVSVLNADLEKMGYTIQFQEDESEYLQKYVFSRFKNVIADPLAIKLSQNLCRVCAVQYHLSDLIDMDLLEWCDISQDLTVLCHDMQDVLEEIRQYMSDEDYFRIEEWVVGEYIGIKGQYNKTITKIEDGGAA